MTDRSPSQRISRRPLSPALLVAGLLALAVLALLLVLGLSVFRQGPASAARRSTPVASPVPGDPLASALARGDDAFDREDYAAAVLAYTDAIALNPNSAEAYNDRGLAHYRLDDAAAALDDYNRALALRPDYPNALTNRAIALFDRGDMQGVIADTTRAIQLDPEADSAYVFRGNAEMRLGDYTQALADTLKAQSIRMSRRNGGL